MPTLLGAAGIDVESTAAALAESFSEVHPLPGRNLMPVVDGAPADDRRAVYLMTRDNMLEGDTGASGLARRFKQTVNPPAPLRIRIPAHTAANFEGLVVRVDEAGGSGHLWKLVRTFDDPGTWTEPGVRQLAANGPGGEVYRTSPLDDQWELYDLTADPIEAVNRWDDPDLHELQAAPADATQAGPHRGGSRAPQPLAVCHETPAHAQAQAALRLAGFGLAPYGVAFTDGLAVIAKLCVGSSTVVCEMVSCCAVDVVVVVRSGPETAGLSRRDPAEHNDRCRHADDRGDPEHCLLLRSAPPYEYPRGYRRALCNFVP